MVVKVECVCTQLLISTIKKNEERVIQHLLLDFQEVFIS